MIQLGEKQILRYIKPVDFGIYLAEDQESETRILLPKKQVPEDLQVGEELEVFLYKDSNDRIIATTNEPAVTLHKTALLKVKEVGPIGAFLDWGLEKDLLLPFKEMTRRVREGDEIVAALYVDKSERLCATMKVYDYLQTDSPYEKEQEVKGIVYEISERFGVFVAVDGKYSALIPVKEAYREFRVGEWIQARVTAVKADGKLDLSVRRRAFEQMDEDAQAVMEAIEDYAGVLPFNDKASAEVIKREMGMSRNAFKRAVGKLLKERKIEITDKSIRKL